MYTCTHRHTTHPLTHPSTHTHTRTHTQRVTYVGRDEHCNAWLLSVVQCTACLYRMPWGCHKFFLGPGHHHHKSLNTRQLSTHSNHHQLYTCAHTLALIIDGMYLCSKCTTKCTNTHFYNIWALVQCS